jgi:conjugal transfer pilus assembly protein TraE
MDFQRHSGDLQSLRHRNIRLSLAVALLSGSHVIALVVILNLLGAVRTVVVPPEIHKTFWVSASHASPQYLEQMASFIAWLVLDVSPGSIDWKKDTLLGYVTPEQHGAFKTRQELESDRLKRINASTAFAPQQLQVNEQAQSVIVRGRLRTFVNGLETTTELRAYQVEFGYASARLHLKTFKEISYANK